MPTTRLTRYCHTALPWFVVACMTAHCAAHAAAHNSWSTGVAMPTALFSATAAVLDGKIYVIGGANGAGVTNIVQVYDPATKSWSAGVPLPAALSGAAAVTVGTNIYVFGGYGTSGISGGAYRLASGGTAWRPAVRPGRRLRVCGRRAGMSRRPWLASWFTSLEAIARPRCAPRQWRPTTRPR